MGTQTASKDLIYKVSDVPVKAYSNGAGRIKLTLVNTFYAKDVIREQLLSIQMDSRTSDWVISSHVDANFDALFFDQMNAEFRETLSSGKYRWVCKPGVRNEALDCTVYALTAVDIARLMTGNAATEISDTVVKAEGMERKDDNDNDDNDDGNDELTLSNLLKDVSLLKPKPESDAPKIANRKQKRKL